MVKHEIGKLIVMLTIIIPFASPYEIPCADIQ